jgi:hypothetical protein
VRFTQDQTSKLEQTFKSRQYINPADRQLLAVSINLTEKQVLTWFSNRRAKLRKEEAKKGGLGSSKSDYFRL